MARSISPEVQAAGAKALADWRKRRDAAKKKGGKALELWEAQEKLKRELKKTTPIMAIKNFCNNCVATRSDITNCTAKQCSLYIYRPYQNGANE
jgi:hypothetical protein